jgi:hypothetical protein
MKSDKQREEVRDEERERALREHVKALRLGHGANCSSIGSVIDTLFVGALVGGAIFAAVAAALAAEEVTVVGGKPPREGESREDGKTGRADGPG